MVYTVSQAEALTGVPRATLRAWERRYGVIAPRRTEGGYRLYDPWQIEMLREMAARVEGGMRPAQAAASLADFRLPPPAGEAAPSGHPDLVAAAVSLNPVVLRRTIDEAFAAGPFEQVITSWLLPQLARIGEAWVAGRLTVAQEHFASAGLMTAVAAAFDEAAEDSHGPTVVVGLPPGGRHQLALLAFATCLRGLGPTVLYLGADLPVADWVIAARSQQARAAVLGAYTAADATSATEVADALTGLSVSVWVGGALGPAVRGATPSPTTSPRLPGTFTASCWADEPRQTSYVVHGRSRRGSPVSGRHCGGRRGQFTGEGEVLGDLTQLPDEMPAGLLLLRPQLMTCGP